MLPSVPATSISIRRRDPATLRALLAVVFGSARVLLTERLRGRGLTGYIALVALRPIFEVGIAALIYRARPDLLSYVVVTLAANAFVFNVNFFVGEILDNERIRGTLAGLFLAPAPRPAWLGGFALVGLFDVALAGGAVLLFGHFGLGVAYAPNWLALALALPLFIAALWGLGFAFSALGLWVKKANPLSNIVAPFMTLLGGAYYPVSQLPEPLHTVARALPNGYGLGSHRERDPLRGEPDDAAAPTPAARRLRHHPAPPRRARLPLGRARGAGAGRTRPVLTRRGAGSSQRHRDAEKGMTTDE